MILRTFLCLMLVAGMSLNVRAGIITVLPAQVHGNNTATNLNSAISTYTNTGAPGSMTLNALPTQLTNPTGANPTTFSGNNVRFGILNTGLVTGGSNNIGAFNDLDTNPNNGNEESLGIAFTGTSGLSSISYDFSRADGTGANDGVIISGFLSNPNVTFTIGGSAVNGGTNFGGTGVAAAQAFWDGTLLRLNIPAGQFNATQRWINFDPLASAGQTLLLKVTDTTQAGAQLAVTSVAYETNAVPEPSSMLMVLAASLVCGCRRRRS